MKTEEDKEKKDEQAPKLLPNLSFHGWRTTSNMMNAEIGEFIDLIVQAVPLMMIKHETDDTKLYRWACWDLIAPGVFIDIAYNDTGVAYCLDCIEDIKHLPQEEGDPIARVGPCIMTEYKIQRYRYSMFIPTVCDEDLVKDYEDEAQVFFDILVAALNDFIERTDSKVGDLDHLKDYFA